MDIKTFNSLIETICNEYSITEKEITKALGYTSGYISQLRSREEFPHKFISKLNYRYPLSAKPGILSEDEVSVKKDDNRMIEIIDRQSRIIESQQTTIFNLTSDGNKESGYKKVYGLY